jgi:hypothetical protein
VPTISSTSRGQAIFVDRATGASLPSYAVLRAPGGAAAQAAVEAAIAELAAFEQAALSAEAPPEPVPPVGGPGPPAAGYDRGAC